MNELQQEISELKQFIADLKADRAAAKAKEKSEAWTKYVSLTVVIIAVVAAIAAQWSGKYGSRVQICQAKASDQWAYFQAKGTKLNLYEVQLAQLQLQQLSLQAQGAVANAYVEKVADYQAKVHHYEQDRKDIEAKARELETARDDATRHGKPFGLAVIFLQVAILLNSIAGLMKRKAIWFLSLPVGLAGLVYFADGFLLFM